MAVLSAPVGVPADVPPALGTTDTDWGHLCTHANINMWAKYKPIRCNKIAPVTLQDRYLVGYGLTRPSLCHSDSYFKTMCLAFYNKDVSAMAYYGGGWEYHKPRGGNYNEPYRITDFIKHSNDSDTVTGYVNNAGKPFSTQLVGTPYFQDSNHRITGGSYGSYINAWEVNLQEVHSLQFRCFKTAFADLTLWDFVSKDTQDTEKPYRFVAEVYMEGTASGTWPGSYPSPNIKLASIPLQKTNEDVFINLDLCQSLFTGHLNQYFHVFLGIQRCDANGQNPFTADSANGTGFVAPWTDSEYTNSFWPFYYVFRAVNHWDTYLRAYAVGYGASGVFTKETGYWKITQSDTYSNRVMFVQFKIERNSTNAYDFCKPSLTEDSGYTRLEVGIAYRTPDISDMVIINAEPCNSSRTAQNHVHVSTGSGMADIYCTVSGVFPQAMNKASSGAVFAFQVYVRTSAGGAWTETDAIYLMRQ